VNLLAVAVCPCKEQSEGSLRVPWVYLQIERCSRTRAWDFEAIEIRMLNLKIEVEVEVEVEAVEFLAR
jgi:hypothetical protein